MHLKPQLWICILCMCMCVTMHVSCEHVLCGYVCAMYAHVCCVCVDEKVSVGVLHAVRVYTVLILIQI